MSPSRLWGALAALLAAITVTVVFTYDTGPDGSHHDTITVTLGGPGHHQVMLTPKAQQIATAQANEDATGNSVAAESNLHETALPAPAVEKAAKALKPAGQPTIPAHVPLAAENVPGCTTMLVRNYSSRRGAPVLFGFIHWTGSAPTRGSPAGGLAIVHWFDTLAASASSSEITDQDGRCWLTVPESQKAWTQAGANPWSVSVEITNAGVQPLFQTAAARNAVLRLMRGWHHRWGIPYRHGIIHQGAGGACIPVRSGFLAHRDAGACGGGHPDVGSFDLDSLIRDAAAGDRTARPITRTDGETCRKLNVYRRDVRRHVKVSQHRTRINVNRRKALERRHLACTAKGPVRR